MYLSKGKELFHHKGCKFACVGVDQTLRRPLAVLLFRNCCKRNCISKDNGQFQKAKLRLRRLFSLQPKAQHYSTPASLRMTKSADGFRLMRSFITPTSKTALPFSEPLDQSARPFPSRNNLTFATFGRNFIDAIASLHCTSGALHFGFAKLHCPAGTLHLPQATSLAKPLHSFTRLSHRVSSSCLATST